MGHARKVMGGRVVGMPFLEVFANEFAGMTTAPVALETLEATRTWLFDALPRALTSAHREFLLSLLRGKPDWELLPFAHLRGMPAVRWKLVNLAKFAKTKPELATAHYAELVARFAALDG